MTLFLIFVVVGLPLGVFALGVGRLGAPWGALTEVAGLPIVAVALWFMATNGSVPVSDRFNEPGLSGLLVGAVVSGLTAPFWIGGYVMGRRARKERA